MLVESPITASIAAPQFDNDRPGLTKLRETLSSFGQIHLLQFWDQLSDADRNGLVDQIGGIDFEQLQRLMLADTGSEDCPNLTERVDVPPVATMAELNADRIAGESLLRRQCVGVLIVAGGEGSRLGFDGAKGCFPIGPVSNASLYQILLEKVVATASRFQVTIPVFLMASPTTHDASVAFLDEFDWFGIPHSARHVFCQGTMPVVALDRRILMESPSQICFSPDGHGGVLPALSRSGLLDVMQQSGIEHLFYCQIDNPVVPLLDPELLGAHTRADSQVTILVIEKKSPQQRTGTVMSIAGRTHILEYSLIPPEIAEQRNADGSLRFRTANTGIHILSSRFLQDQANRPESLPFHRAIKAVAHVNDDGQLHQPAQPNAIKFERFIFDIFPQATRTLLIERPQDEVFVPLKDAGSAESSPTAVRQQMSRLHRRWLEQAGVSLPSDLVIEISPLFATNATQVAERLAESSGLLPQPIKDGALMVQ